MVSRTPVLAVATALVLLVGTALTGCATDPEGGLGPGSRPDSDPRSEGGSADALEVDAAWLDAGRQVGVVTYGSSSCIPAAEVGGYEDGVLTVELLDDPAAACTRDIAPRVSVVPLPPEVDPSQDLVIAVDYGGVEGEVALEGVPGVEGDGETDYFPSAGWMNADDQFVFLSWGSSSCLPLLEEVTASGPAEITMTFAMPDANQVCTADMAPRAMVVGAPDLEEDSDVFAVLANTSEFDNMRIPILGSN